MLYRHIHVTINSRRRKRNGNSAAQDSILIYLKLHVCRNSSSRRIYLSGDIFSSIFISLYLSEQSDKGKLSSREWNDRREGVWGWGDCVQGVGVCVCVR